MKKHLPVFAFLLAACAALAQVPSSINYQGRLLNGTNLVNGSVELWLRLYTDPVAGVPLFEDTGTVTVVDGVYATQLGDGPSLGSFPDVLTNAPLYVEVVVNGTVLTPREPLASVAYALVAGGVTTGAVTAAGVAAATFSNTFWKLNGNAASNAPVHFFGTTDDVPLEFRQRSIRVLYVSSGTGSPNFCVGSTANDIPGNCKGSSILGGSNNHFAAGVYMSTIAGGEGNLMTAGADGCAIGGGWINFLSNSQQSVIGGGATNSIGIYSDYSVIAGGVANHIGGTGRCVSILGGGWNNIAADGDYSTIVGGRDNSVAQGAQFALVAGRQAKANHGGTFIWADNMAADFGSATSNQFLIRASGGVGINTTNTTAGGLSVAGDVAVTGALSAANFIGSGGGLTAGTVSNAALAPNAVTSSKIADGSIDDADINVAANILGSKIAAGTISNTQVNAASFSTTFWKADGNAGTVAGMNFLGTTDNRPLELRANSLRVALFVWTNGCPNITLGSPANTIASGSHGCSILGGSNNLVDATSFFNTIGGGLQNEIGVSSKGVTIAGGGENAVTNSWFATIAGGLANTVGTADHGAVGGGWDNHIGSISLAAVIAGGQGNSIGRNAEYSVIPGGQSNSVAADADYSYAAGNRARADHAGSFVWADKQGLDFRTTGTNQFLIRASGGVGINTTNPLVDFRVSGNAIIGTNLTTLANSTNVLNLMVGQSSNGAVNGISFYEDYLGNHMSIGYDGISSGAGNKMVIYGLTNQPLVVFENGGNLGIGVENPTNLIHVAGGAQCNGSTWLNSSDRNLKENFAPVDPAQVLEKVEALPISEWNYKRDGAAKRHIGPVAQDFYAVFGVGDNDTTISTIDPSGVALAAIQALARENEAGRRQNAVMQRQIQELKKLLDQARVRLDALEQR